MAGAWKVAYADFVTAMMAFFLLMWILGMSSKDTLAGLAGYFSADAAYVTNTYSPLVNANNDMIQSTKMATAQEFSESEKSNIAIVRALKKAIMQDAQESASSGISSDNLGVLLHMTPDALFEPGSITLSEKAQQALDGVIQVMNKYKVYLVIRGYADTSEIQKARDIGLPSLWDLAAARANAAANYLQSHGVPGNQIRTVSYADSRPQVPDIVAGAAEQNARVEFYFHRPELLSNSIGY